MFCYILYVFIFKILNILIIFNFVFYMDFNICMNVYLYVDGILNIVSVYFYIEN